MIRFYKWLLKKYSKNYTVIPLFYVTFNLQLYKQNGVQGSCIIGTHPSLKNDNYVEDAIKDLITYIRKNYEMEDLST